MKDPKSEILELFNKYHQRQKDRLVFAGNLSLNKLATEMYEDMSCSGIDPSTVSRVLQGKRFFTKKQLDSFCKIVRVEENDKKRLYKLTKKVILIRYDFL